MVPCGPRPSASAPPVRTTAFGRRWRSSVTPVEINAR